jgi:hypothetical protein
MDSELIKLQTELDKAMKIIQAYESFEGDVAHAMHKVGWSNSRIESAYDELQETLLDIDREV